MRLHTNKLCNINDIEISRCWVLTKSNIKEVIAISEIALGKNYLLPDDLVHPSYRWVLATIENKVVGFASFMNDHSNATITDVAVDPIFQGYCIATNLIAQCVFEISTLWVEVIDCFAWETNNYPHLEKPLLRNGFVRIRTELRVSEDYRDNFECPICGIGCTCNAVLFRKNI